MLKYITLIVLMMFSQLVSSATLTTKNYVVTVTPNCQEGNVTCDDVIYVGRSKTTGQTITLEGHTLHRWCADGVTPCQFLGYEFKNGRFIYSVLERGVLKVEKNGHSLINEKGEWNY